jgi:hypothetical protein
MVVAMVHQGVPDESHQPARDDAGEGRHAQLDGEQEPDPEHGRRGDEPGHGDQAFRLGMVDAVAFAENAFGLMVDPAVESIFRQAPEQEPDAEGAGQGQG